MNIYFFTIKFNGIIIIISLGNIITIFLLCNLELENFILKILEHFLKNIRHINFKILYNNKNININ